ncbi:uncharacterized protein N7482_001207 [Penicillium canariense]|uniref:Uncharacterized protein n=1 Tax=Penicillium canariense TaxID=189055 RepID=A0A9W9IG58_9EURO|nr:uncharacterized protein N7482_001207 [Penicillium canariense]KAJ5175330.1 hypothetical protein N7482_001207 [Penicillium canariense]
MAPKCSGRLISGTAKPKTHLDPGDQDRFSPQLGSMIFFGGRAREIPRETVLLSRLNRTTSALFDRISSSTSSSQSAEYLPRGGSTSRSTTLLYIPPKHQDACHRCHVGAGPPACRAGSPSQLARLDERLCFRPWPAQALRHCGQLLQPEDTSDYDTYKTGDWLNNWWNSNQNLISSNSAGFAGAFGQWALGNPDWTCRDDGSNSDCDLDLCDNRVLNDRGDDIRTTYYVLESVNRLHTYFTGVGQAFTTAALGAALSKDSWATTFYKDKDDKSATVLKEVLNAVATVVGIGATFAGLGYPLTGAVGGAAAALIGGANGAAGPVVDVHQDDTFQKSADLGGILGTIVVDSLKSFTTANNQLMAGQSYGNNDIRSYLSGGAFLAYAGVDKNAVTDAMTSMLIGTSINQLYRTQKIFVMGGGACGDNQGIGSGPSEAVVCRDGKAWYLYYWQENDVISTTSHQWGWVASPPGAEKLGANEYGSVTVADIINSSLDAYNVAGYDYSNDKAASRAEEAYVSGWGNPGAKGAAWEGIFTIPVCDVGAAVNSDYSGKEYILQPYGHDSRPVWCGAICGGDVQKTKDFIHAANMDGFMSPKHLCPTDAGY